MGTHGMIKITIKGKSYYWYIHWDAPDVINGIITELGKLFETHDFYEILKMFLSLKIVNEKMAPTLDEIKHVKKFGYEIINSNENNWYYLVSRCNYTLKSTLEVGYLYDSNIMADAFGGFEANTHINFDKKNIDNKTFSKYFNFDKKRVYHKFYKYNSEVLSYLLVFFHKDVAFLTISFICSDISNLTY